MDSVCARCKETFEIGGHGMCEDCLSVLQDMDLEDQLETLMGDA
jgi:hypothetical protein